MRNSRTRTALTAGLVALMVAVAGSAAPAQAPQESPARGDSPLASRMAVYKVLTGEDGRETFTPAKEASPGDILEYRVIYSNSGDAAVNGVVATLPVPEGTEFLGQSASPARYQATLDRSSYAAAPLTERVTTPSGRSRIKRVPYERYRALRWELGEIAPGKSLVVKARARLKTETPTRLGKAQN